MAPGDRAQLHGPARALVASLAAGLPLLFACAAVGSEPGWGEQGHVLAGALALDAEATPLAQWWWRFLLTLPIGSLALRAAMASAAAVAIAAAAVALTVEAVARAQGARAEVAAGLAVALAWLLAATPSVWRAAAAPTEGALSIALAAAALERWTAHELSWPSFDRRPLYGAAIVIGLASAHEPWLALALLAAGAPTCIRVARAGEAAALGRGAMFAGPGVVAAIVWWLQGRGWAETTPVALADSLGALVPLAAVGAFALRAAALRRPLTLALAAVATLGVLAWARISTLAVLTPMALLVAAAPAWLLATEARSALRAVVAASLAALALLWLRHTSLSEPPRTCDTTRRLLARDAVGEAAPREVLLIGSALAPMLAASSLEQGLRPDVVRLSLPGLASTEAVRQATRAHPELTALLREHVLSGRLSAVDLQSLAAQRPVSLEVTDATDPELYPTLAPGRLLYTVLPSEATATDVRAGARAHEAFDEAVDDAIAAAPLPSDARAWLTATRRGNALYLMAAGQREAASRAIDRAEAVDDAATGYAAMRRALGEAVKGPVDVTPWLRR